MVPAATIYCIASDDIKRKGMRLVYNDLTALSTAWDILSFVGANVKD